MTTRTAAIFVAIALHAGCSDAGDVVVGTRPGEADASLSPDARAGPACPGMSGDVAAVAAGDDHTCALLVNGAAWCWGQNEAGQLGDGTTDGQLQPVPVGGVAALESIAAGDHSCGIRAGGTVWCWGDNDDGELGLGDTEHRDEPTGTCLTAELGSTASRE